MKTIRKTILIMAGILFISSVGYGQKTQSFTVKRTIDAPADKVWKVVGEEFADIAKSHPLLAGSHYVEGSPLAGEGCERVCNLSEDGSKYTKEKMVNYDPLNYSFKAEIEEAGGLPLESNTSYMLYDVDKIDENSSTISLTMVYRTKPAFMGKLAKGKFKKNIENYAIAIQHYTKTGEDVNPENFDEIKKLYL